MNMPWHNTQSLAKGIEGLNRMYNSLLPNNPLKLFLDKHCLHLLKPLQGDTGIPIEYKDPKVLLTLQDTVSLSPQYNPQDFEGLPKVCTYAFFLEGEEKVTQCGSTIRVVNRMQTHYAQANKQGFIFNVNPIDMYKFVPIKSANNYVDMFSTDNQMTAEDEYILTSFMQQEIRSLEQAYTTYAEPTNYKGMPVNTWHNNWVEGTSNFNNSSKRVTWITTDGEVHSRNSIDSAAAMLNCDRKTLHHHAKQIGTLLDSSKYGKVSIAIEGVVKSSKPVDKRYDTPINTFINYDLLVGNKYYLFDPDMNLLSQGPYNTANELSEALPCAYGAVNLWCNYLHLIKSVNLGTSVYIVKRTVDLKMAAVIHCLTDNTVTEFGSMKSALNYIQKGLTTSEHVLSCIVNNKPFTNKEGFSYLIKYKHQQHLDNAVQRLAKARATRKATKAARHTK